MTHISIMGELTVSTEGGSVRGTGGRLRSFKGIPYAQPPVGALRWRPPLRHEGWTATLDASRFRADCVQHRHSTLRGDGMSEDCLFLNIWTAAASRDARLPVMVWIHGDGYTRGSGSIPTYDGEELATRGVVLVTINYRLGLPGFLAHRGLTAESPNASSGNYGLLDQLAALGWIKRNIAQFGGDPHRVTVFGQSAGGTCTQLLMASPLAEGLVDQAILHSPGSMRPMATLAEAEVAGAAIGTDTAAMRALPIDELLEMTDLLVPPVRKLASPRGLGPIVDGWVVQGDDMENYRTGAVRAIPVIVGTDEQEGRRLAARFPLGSVEDYHNYLTSSFGGGTALPESYRANDVVDIPAALERVVGDTQFNYGAWNIAQGMHALGGPVFHYLFTQPTPEKGLPPTHDDELPYAFGNLHHGGIRPDADAPGSYGPEDRTVSEEMMAAWVRFAATGNPDRADGQDWPQSDGRGPVRIFGPGTLIEGMPRTADLEFLQGYFGHAARA